VSFNNMEAFKDQLLPSAKLFNWNIITDAFSKLSINIDYDMKSLIVAGDNEMVNEILKDIQK